jgi:eukaryotic-like serine/threonine-protein kinase
MTLGSQESAKRAAAPAAAPATEPVQIRPGAVSALLLELARTPGEAMAEAWGAALRPGMRVGRFELVGELGQGGFGIVFEAVDVELGRRVAFKALVRRSRLDLGEEWLRREAEAVAQLNHPNIVTLHDIGVHQGNLFLVLELLQGETLAQRLRRGPMPPAEVVRVAVEVARGLAHAHGAGVLHRDLKPGNVFLTRGGGVKVLDFGLARILGVSGLRGSGTPAYMAPEQWRGEPEDERTDVFALGVMLHEMLAGARPFEATGERSAVLDPGPPPALRAAGVPKELSALAGRAISRDPSDRPRDGRALLEALLPVERALARGPSRALRRTAGIAAAVALLGGVGAAAWRLWPEGALEPVTVAVADFENETGERDLDGLSGLLITSLEQSRHLSVLTRSRMLDLARAAPGAAPARIDEPLGREIGRRAGARALLLATIRRFDGLYAVEVKALDPVADAYLFTLKEEGTGKASIPGLLDRLSERARRSLRETAAEVSASRVSVGDAVTRSLEAYQHYFAGVQCIDGIVYPGQCLSEFQQALSIDPTFALAHYMLAYGTGYSGESPEEAKAHVAEALRHIDRAPEKERGLILAWNDHLEGRDEEALARYRQVMERWPQDQHAPYLAGDLLFHKHETDAALPYFERALSLGNAIPVARSHLIESLALAGRADEGLARAKAWVAEAPGAASYRMLCQAEVWAGDASAAVEAARRALAAGGGPETRLDLAASLAYAGDLAKADAELRSLAGPGLTPHVQLIAATRRANLLALQGRRRAGLQVLDALAGEIRDEDGRKAVRWSRAAYLAAGGPAAEAWREMQGLPAAVNKMSPPLAVLLAYHGDLEHATGVGSALPSGRDRALLRAVVQWRSGDGAGAAAALRAIDRPRDAGVAYLLGDLLLEMGDDREAAGALVRFQSMYSPDAWWSWAYPRSLYLLARARDRLGDRAGARQALDRLLALWTDADADLPLLSEARALRARIGA